MQSIHASVSNNRALPHRGNEPPDISECWEVLVGYVLYAVGLTADGEGAGGYGVDIPCIAEEEADVCGRVQRGDGVLGVVCKAGEGVEEDGGNMLWAGGEWGRGWL